MILAKKKCKELFLNFSKTHNVPVLSLVISNVFGEFCKPHYNSVVATFANDLVSGGSPKIITDAEVDFIYIANLVKTILYVIEKKQCGAVEVKCDFTMKVSTLLAVFEKFKSEYFDRGIIPQLRDTNKRNLFNTFRS